MLLDVLLDLFLELLRSFRSLRQYDGSLDDLSISNGPIR